MDVIVCKDFRLASGSYSSQLLLFVVCAVVTERDVLALSKSPFVVQLFYSLQSKLNIFLVSNYFSIVQGWLDIYR